MEINEKLSGKKRKASDRDNYEENELGEVTFKKFDDEGDRERSRVKQKEIAMEKKYEHDKKSEMLKKFAHSSFLTPESAAYLNEVMKKQMSSVDQEMVYTGQHDLGKSKIKFKRQKKNPMRHKNRIKGSAKKRGRTSKSKR